MEFLKNEFRIKFQSLQEDFETKSVELQTILSQAHTHALVTAHTHGDNDVKALGEDYFTRLESVTFSHNEKIKLIESLNQIKMESQKNEFLRKFEEQKDGFEIELSRQIGYMEELMLGLKEVSKCFTIRLFIILM
jgi:hypothetical protein